MPASATRPKPRVARPFTYPTPTKGWIANENLANPTPGGAAQLENWFPTATGLRVRGGNELYATLGNGTMPVTAIFDYNNGLNERLFASTADAIYDVTNVFSPVNIELVSDEDDGLVTDDGDTLGSSSTAGLDVLTGQAGGNWVVVQFATAGGVYLVGVNGEGSGFVFDGDYFYPYDGTGIRSLPYDAGTGAFAPGETVSGLTSGATGTVLRVLGTPSSGALHLTNVTGGPFQDNETLDGSGTGAATAAGASTTLFGGVTGVPTEDLDFLWVYKQRLWFVQKNSLSARYLPTDQISGTLVEFPMGGVFGRGGSLMFGATWSLDSGAEGGLSEQCVFVTTEGEVAVYQGTNPADANAWSKVGVYRIGRPLGNKAFFRAGGDIAIATDIGLIPLSQAIQRDVAALSPIAVSFPIEVAWNERVAYRGALPWHIELWPTKQMTVIALPTAADTKPEMLVANVRTGAWTLYTGWDGTCLRVFKERLFFGSQDGKVVEAEVTGSDQGAPYTALCVPLFDDMQTPAGLKTAGMARATFLSPYPVNERITVQRDFSLEVPPAPDALAVGGGAIWGLSHWGQASWGATTEKKTQQAWRSVGGQGYAFAPAIQVTSGSVPPPQIELVRIEMTYQLADKGP